MKTRVIALIAALSLGILASCSTGNQKAAQPSATTPDKPLPRLVITHAMGMMPATGWWGGQGLFPLTEYAKSRPPEYFTRIYGGQYRMLPLGTMHAYTEKDGTYNFNKNFFYPSKKPAGAIRPEYVENPYLWDLQWADRMGVDGFGLCLSGNEPSYKHAVNWFKTLEQMLKDKPETKVRITIDICGNELPTAKQPKKYEWLKRFAKEFKDSPAWLRHNNRIILAGYHSMITWDTQKAVDPQYIKGAVKANKDFIESLKLGNPYFIFDGSEYVPGQITHRNIKPNPELLASIAAIACKEFDGYMTWGGIIPDEIYPDNYRVIAKEVNKLGKCWGMPILDIHSGIGQFYKSKPGVERLLDTWNLAKDTDAQIAQLVTWNDSNEATCFVPTISFNYAFASLNAKFIYRFKHGSFPDEKEDMVYLFYRKYHPDADPYLYPRATVERDCNKWGETDDMLHVIVFAKDTGTIAIGGTAKGTVKLPVKKGFNEFKLKTAVNQEIAARIYRNGKLEHELVSPERVTDRPFREDLIPWGWSSDCRKYYDMEFGKNFRPISYYSQRYNDGIPDWFRLLYFGTTELPTGGLPNADPDNDGVTNLNEYLLGEDPTKPNPVYKQGYTWDEIPKALSVAEKQQFSARINLNPYPDKNGKLVHTFLYAPDGKLDGQYPHMVKWVNKVKGTKTGWTTRDGIKHHYYLTKDNGIGMDLYHGWAGIYGFWSPVKGKINFESRLVGDPKTPVTFTITQGNKTLYTKECAPGKEIKAELQLNINRRDRIDFIVKSVDNKSATVIMYPQAILAE